MRPALDGRVELSHMSFKILQASPEFIKTAYVIRWSQSKPH